MGIPALSLLTTVIQTILSMKMEHPIPPIPKNPVPCILVSDQFPNIKALHNGSLADVAPTLLALLEVEKGKGNDRKSSWYKRRLRNQMKVTNYCLPVPYSKGIIHR